MGFDSHSEGRKERRKKGGKGILVVQMASRPVLWAWEHGVKSVASGITEDIWSGSKEERY